jgi:hypothetical protein
MFVPTKVFRQEIEEKVSFYEFNGKVNEIMNLLGPIDRNLGRLMQQIDCNNNQSSTPNLFTNPATYDKYND